MAHFALVCPDEAGHLLPVGSVGKELQRRGHRVTIVARPLSAPLARELDLPLHEWNTEEIPLRPSRLLWLAFSLGGGGALIALRDLLVWYVEAVLQRLPPVLEELAVDGLVIDEIIPAGGTVAEHLGLPYVTVSSALMWHQEAALPPQFTGWPFVPGRAARARNRLGYAAWRWYMRPLLTALNRQRKAWRLPSFQETDDTHSPFAHLAQSCPEFDFPRRELPATFHYVGSLGGRRKVSDNGGFPWDRLDGRPLIFASMGTVLERINVPVLRKVAAACAGLEAQLVMAMGKWNDKQDDVMARLGSVPGDPIVVEYAPQLALLDRAALLITHAGLNTTLESLCRGVPIVAIPRAADQPAVAARIEYSGAGLRGPWRHGPRPPPNHPARADGPDVPATCGRASTISGRRGGRVPCGRHRRGGGSDPSPRPAIDRRGQGEDRLIPSAAMTRSAARRGQLRRSWTSEAVLSFSVHTNGGKQAYAFMDR